MKGRNVCSADQGDLSECPCRIAHAVCVSVFASIAPTRTIAQFSKQVQENQVPLSAFLFRQEISFTVCSCKLYHGSDKNCISSQSIPLFFSLLGLLRTLRGWTKRIKKLGSSATNTRERGYLIRLRCAELQAQQNFKMSLLHFTVNVCR